ncbi:S-adenosyl-L-methionine-dependent methyltransferases superfamily protein [Raphanus sativus]|nr:S-adenosyl-L-methionine-dependent methyltransferases superfamily protein [Raphanus sativus]
MLDLPFDTDCFDVVIEKGTMDVLFVDAGDPWNPRQETVSKVMATLDGVHRPHFRRPLFMDPKFNWSMEYNTFGDGFHYFFYILRKGKRRIDEKGEDEKHNDPPINMYQDELEGEDYLFRTNIDADED